jgi:hypothetical protein
VTSLKKSRGLYSNDEEKVARANLSSKKRSLTLPSKSQAIIKD